MTTIQKIVLLTISAITIVTLTGCGSNKNLTIPTEQIITDKNSAYVVFMREDTFHASGYSATISEFFPETKEAIKIADLSVGEKVIHKVNTGKHYFHINFGLGLINTLNAVAGKVYYLDVSKISFISSIDEQEVDIITDKLIGAECSKQILDKYLLLEESNGMIKVDELKQSKNSYKNNEFSLKIDCQDNKILDVGYLFGMKIADLKSETELIQPSNKKLQEDALSSIIEDFVLYVSKFEGIPYREGTSISIIKEFDNVNYKKFNSNDLDIIFSEIKTEEGSQLGRYFSLTYANMRNNGSTTKMICTVKLKSTGEIITILNGSSVTTLGILGGFDTGKKDLINIFNTYIKTNLYI